MNDKDRPHPPGNYPVVIVGSGPGGLQTSYCLSRAGVKHAVISADGAPGGMFQQFPLFQRLISWTKPYAPVDRESAEYEWYDWNSLLADAPGQRALVAGFMDGTSYFPARSEMQAGLREFAQRAAIEVRYGCRWEATRRDESTGGLTLFTSDGEYRCKVAVFAVGASKPWKPEIAGLDQVPHYVDVKKAGHYRDKSVFIIGKRNSGLEIADALLPVAKRLVLGSPRPAKISVVEHSTSGARARYLQPYEDHVFGGGHRLVDIAIERVERHETGYAIHGAYTNRPGPVTFMADEAIAATGFSVPLGDLPEVGVAVFNQGRLPAQTPFWESASAPGIYFAGSVTQGSVGLRKYGLTGNSAGVHGFRYNARILARRIAEEHFGLNAKRERVAHRAISDLLLAHATRSPELWNQPSYLARAYLRDESGGFVDDGAVPLAHFVDSGGPDAAAVTVETDDRGEIHPALYLRRSGRITEHLMAPHPLHDFETADHRAQMKSLLKTLPA